MHPDSVSIPMTCAPTTGPVSLGDGVHNDWMAYILYHDDAPLLRQVIGSAVASLGVSMKCMPLPDTLAWFGSTQGDSMDMLRAKLVVLLDQDERTRRDFTTFRSDTCRLRQPLPPLKADRFYGQLHDEVIPKWICNEDVALETFVDDVRMAYLIS